MSIKLSESDNTLASKMGNSKEPLTEEKSEEYKSKWRSIRISYVIMFFSSICYSIQLPSIWAYMITINYSYSKELMGWVVASYSIGQLVACPVFSYISGRTMNFRVILMFCAILAIAGNFLYSILEDINKFGQTVALFASRLIIGISGGNIAPIRLFLTLITTEEERLGPLTTLSVCQGLGFIIGPGIQAALVPLGYPGEINLPFLRVNSFTSSGQLNMITNLIIFIILCLFCGEGFLRIQSATTDESVLSSETENKIVNSGSSKHEFKNDYFCAIFMLVAFFICMMSISVLETAAAPITMDSFAWTKNTATFINSITLCADGVGSIIIYSLLQIFTKRIKERFVLIGGFGFVLVSVIVLIPMGTSKMVTHNRDSNSTGCNIDTQPWCQSVPALEYWQFVLTNVFFTIGYPTANVMVFVIFSRLIDPVKQGLWTGLLTGSGSLARLMGPIFIMKLYEKFGTQIAFGSWSAIIFLFLISTPFFMLRMSKRDKWIKSQLP